MAVGVGVVVGPVLDISVADGMLVAAAVAVLIGVSVGVPVFVADGVFVGVRVGLLAAYVEGDSFPERIPDTSGSTNVSSP